MSKWLRLFQPLMVEGSYKPLAGVGYPNMNWWDWYAPGQWTPRWAAAGSQGMIARLMYEKNKLWWGPGKERVEMMVGGEKLFEGMAGLVDKQYCDKFPDVRTADGGVFSPRSQLVVMHRLTNTTTQADAAATAWTIIYQGPVSTLKTADDVFGIFAIFSKAPLPDTHLASGLDVRPLYHQIAHVNMAIPYVFLVDSEGLIRWRSCWKPTKAEEEFLTRGTWTLD